MGTNPGNDGDSFVEGLVQKPVTHAEPQRKDQFAQWHKPRKHWIRRNQWQAEATALIQALNITGRQRPLSYMSLPGPDMLDVRAVHHACASAGVGLRFLGFMSGDTADRTELNISLDEVMRLPGVSQDSMVVQDSLQTLADPKSVGYSRAENAAPFDIVNVDLCNSVGGAPPLDQQAGCYDALRRIIELQVRKRPAEEPWILFLTTRSNHQTVNAQARARFFDCLLKNARDHAEVDAAIREGLALDQAALENLSGAQINAAASFESAFAAAVSKWLLQLLGSGAPAGTLQLLPSSCVYGIRQPGMMDMLSLGFRCQTVIAAPVDGAGLAAPVVAQHNFPTEPQAAAAIIRRVPQMQNVDRILRASVEIYAQMSADAAEFMKAARFDAGKYLEWAARLPEAPETRAV